MGYKTYIYRNLIPILGVLATAPRQIPIIYYHNIVPDGHGFSFMHTDLSTFKNHMNYLKSNDYTTYTFDEIPPGFIKDKKSKEVVITFDDGFISNYQIAYPMLRDLNLKFNIFLTVEYIEKNIGNYLTWEMIREMYNSRIVGFGAHTYTHVDCRKINPVNYDVEIDLTNSVIHKNVGCEVKDFCFPFGLYNSNILTQLCKSKAYNNLYTSDYKKITTLNDCNIIGRAGISTTDDIKVFSNKLKGQYNIMYYITRILNRVGTLSEP